MKELNEQVEALLKNDLNHKTALEQILDILLAKFHSETGTIHILDSQKQLLNLAAQVGLPPHISEVVKIIPVGKGIAGQVVAENRPVTTCNLQTDSSGVAKSGAKQTGVGGALCVPIRDGEKILGTLGIGTVREHEYSAAEINSLQEIANRLGDFLKG
jgi:L-methionine (R)-S-oxide reductase